MGGAPVDVPKIFTTAKAERKVDPNMAKITFAVLTRASTAEKAREENAKKMSALVEKLKELKVSEDHVQTLDYRIQEIVNYQNGASKIEGYEVLNRMQITILDMNGVGKMLDQLVALGANKVEGVEFDVAEKDEIYKDLLEEATGVAREKAGRMAEAAGLGKVSVLEVREELSFSAGPTFKMSMAMAEAASDRSSTPMAGTATLQASVALTAKARD